MRYTLEGIIWGLGVWVLLGLFAGHMASMPEMTTMVTTENATDNYTESQTTTPDPTTSEPKPKVIVSVSVKYSVDKPFDIEMLDEGSAVYAAIKAEIVVPIEATLRNADPGFQSITEAQFSPGSVVATIVASYQRDASSADSAALDAAALQTSIQTTIRTAVADGSLIVPGLDPDSLTVVVPLNCPSGYAVEQIGNFGVCARSNGKSESPLKLLIGLTTLLILTVIFSA